MRHDKDEFDEIEMDEADAKAREELMREITSLYQKNLRSPSPIGTQLEKALRDYLALADSLRSVKNEEEEDEVYAALDELDVMIGELRAAFEGGGV